MSPLTTRDLCAACDGALIAGDHGPLGAISTDSRALQPGAAFFALRGPSFDGHAFAAQAVAAGAATLILARDGAWSPDLIVSPELIASGVAVVVVEDTFKALEALAAYQRARFQGVVIALTGSSGKTTTKDMLAAALSPLGAVHKTPGNWNNQLGVPLTLLGLRDQPFAVIELGTNAPGEIAALAALTRPQIGIITGIGLAHTAGLGELRAVAVEKAALLHALPPEGLAVVPEGLPYGEAALAGLAAPLLRLSEAADQARLIDAPQVTLEGTRARLSIGGVVHTLTLQLSGTHHVTNARLALNVALRLGAPIDAALAALAALPPPPLRGEIRRLADGAPLILDCYNANPQSMAAATRAFVAAAPEGIVVLGEMRELGDLHDEAHLALGRLLAEEAPKARVVAVGEAGALILKGAGAPSPRLVLAPDVAAVAPILHGLRAQGQPILFKASRGVRLERAAEALMELR
ncbi:UDP-N-acetylmuramoyl-tripeptide--D-alanyl-D-alanine ligase [Myxococcota bacterium]|nr:UDP-N-acetylmuramoyl-tripeptide--D-alanyl-D-alanine ligase [Myxococcota bacterium]